MWQNSLQVRAFLTEELGCDPDYDRTLNQLFLTSVVLNGSILRSKFESDDELFANITLTEYGLDTFQSFPTTFGIASESEKKAAALLVPYLHRPLVDISNSNFDELIAHLSKSIQERSILLPDRFGRVLYDKFNADFSEFARNRVSHLDHDSSLTLLEGAEQGVYQIGKYLCGPFGIFESNDKRFIPVTRDVPLWHCEDTGCNHLHHVELRSFEHNYIKLASTLKSEFVAIHGRPSEWQVPFYHNCIQRGPALRGNAFFDAPVLLGEAFGIEEIASILERSLLSKNRNDLQAKLSEAKYKSNWLKQAPSEVAASASLNEAIQFLSSLPAKRLVELIDFCIEEKLIGIPENEVRETKTEPPKVSQRDPTTQVSSLGVRSVRSDPVSFMAELIWKAYGQLDQLEELEWRCRRASGSASLSSPIDYIRLNDPAEAVRELILPSKEIVSILANELAFSNPSFEDQDKLIEKFLWKFGFTRARYDGIIARIDRQLSAFKQQLFNSNEPPTENERDKIREKGVNLFVNIERYLEDLIAYNAWMFWSDHFLETKFVFNRKAAVASVSVILGESISTGTFSCKWDSDGANTLGVLLVYGSKLAAMIGGLPTQSGDEVIRADEDLPHYDDATRFVFRHEQAWADFADIEIKSYAEQFAKLFTLLNRSKIDFVRNGLDHFREEGKFPSTEDLTNFATFFEQALHFSEQRRLYPVALWLVSASQDDVGKKHFKFSDYSGREVNVHRPGLIVGLRAIGFGRPYLIPSVNLIGHSNSELCFAIRDHSVFSSLWENYPIRQSWKSKAQDIPNPSDG